MSVMSDMLADVLKKSVPPEVFAMLTPENMQTFKNNAEQLVTELRQGIANCQAQNVEIIAMLDSVLATQGHLMERTENVGRDDSSSPRPARKRGSGNASGDGSGD